MGFLFGNACNESGSLSKITLELNVISLASISPDSGQFM